MFVRFTFLFSLLLSLFISSYALTFSVGGNTITVSQDKLAKGFASWIASGGSKKLTLVGLGIGLAVDVVINTSIRTEYVSSSQNCQVDLSAYGGSVDPQAVIDCYCTSTLNTYELTILTIYGRDFLISSNVIDSFQKTSYLGQKYYQTCYMDCVLPCGSEPVPLSPSALSPEDVQVLSDIFPQAIGNPVPVSLSPPVSIPDVVETQDEIFIPVDDLILSQDPTVVKDISSIVPADATTSTTTDNTTVDNTTSTTDVFVAPDIIISTEFDTSIEVPQQKTLVDTISNLISQSPVFEILINTNIQVSSTQCTFNVPVSLGGFSSTGVIDFCQFSDVLSAIGSFILAFAHFFAIWIVFKGD